MKLKLFIGGCAAGIMMFATCLLLGFGIEQSSLFQLYNFNEAAARGRYMALSTIEHTGGDAMVADLLASGYLDKYKIDASSGAGWVVPMKCLLSVDQNCWSASDSDNWVVLFMWRGRPFSVSTFGDGCLPRVCAMRLF